MRIVGGKFRGRRLVAPTGRQTRPSTDRLREALFNILDHRENGLTGCRVLDLFAGSGALGLEAVSRGAEFALFVETDAAARGTIRQNIETLALEGQTRVFRRDARHLGPLPTNVGGAFDVVFMDPPYTEQELDGIVGGLLEGGWIAEGTLFVIERGSDQPPLTVPGLKLADQRRYGDSHLFFYEAEES